MKIAAISDIHGNIAALEAVLAHVAGQHVDMIVNLGDICSGALFPQETADRLITLALPTIAGNHERQILTLPFEAMGLSDQHAARSLRPKQLDWFRSLPSTMRIAGDVLLVHGTPDSDVAYFLETVTDAGLREATPPEVEERARDTQAPITLCGHTHLPRVVRLRDGRMIVNPGSVGLPAYGDDRPHRHVVENGSPHARYAVIQKSHGAWSAELFAIEYDWERAALDAEENGRSDWARALRTGLV